MTKIMLVDDSAYMRGVLKKILKTAGYSEFVEAADGEAAVGTYPKERPDVVLMDIVMPNKNGLDALRDIRQFDPGARVLMVTAIGQDVVMEEAKQSGAVGYVVKPFDPQQVKDALERALHGGPAG